MDSSSTGMIITLIILVMCSAYFSATEMAFSSLNRIRVKNLANDGNKKAALALSLIDRYDDLLSSILIGNNVVNIAASAIATVLFIEMLGSDAGATMSTIVMTVVVLIFGEISPKSLAKEQPEAFAMVSAPFMRMFIWVMTPFNWIFGLWKKLLQKVFKTKENTGITDEELLTIVEEAQSEGEIDEEEGDLIKSAIEFKDLDAGDILTARVDLTAVDVEEDHQAIYRVFMESRFSRIPVYKDTIDNIIGVIHQRDFFVMLHTKGQTLQEIIKPAIFVSDSIKISKLIKHLQKSKAHMAIVTDEYGGTMGIVTMEDILEELVGEIWDEHDDVVQDIEKISENEYYVLGSADVEELFELFDLECDIEQNTVSGWVMEQLDKMPEIGDTFTDGCFHVTVKELDGRRVGKVLVHYDPVVEDEEEE